MRTYYVKGDFGVRGSDIGPFEGFGLTDDQISNIREQRRKQMKKEEYRFIAKYADIDFRRIVETNTDASFLCIFWADDSGGVHTLLLATERGATRLENAGMNRDFTSLKYDIYVRYDGSLGYRAGAAPPLYEVGQWWPNPEAEGTTREAQFKDMYNRLREREDHMHKVAVTAVY